MNRRALLLVLVVVVVLAVAGPFIALSRDTKSPEQPVPLVDRASVRAKAYVEKFISADGNGNGSAALDFAQQSRALLITAATADRARFDTVWNKTRTMAAPDGTYTTARPADMLVAIRAFMVASQRLNAPEYLDSAQPLATQLLARHYAQPGVLGDPKAMSAATLQTRTITLLAALPGANSMWSQIATENQRIQDSIFLDKGVKLVADSVAVAIDGGARNVEGATYGNDAQTAVLALKDSCDPRDNERARQAWLTLRLSPDSRLANALDPSGEVKDVSATVQAAVATASTAEVAGESVQAGRLLEQADAIADAADTPEALSRNAIGRIIVSTDWLGAC